MTTTPPLSSTATPSHAHQAAELEKSEKMFYLKTQAIVILAFSFLLVVFGILGYGKAFTLPYPLAHVCFFSGISTAAVTIWSGRRIQKQLT